MIKLIEFNLRDTIAYINSTSLTTMKLFMSSPPFVKINWSLLTAEQRYDTLMQVFEGCKEGVPMPANPTASRSKIDSFGFSTWRKFAEGGRHCSIELNPGTAQFEITPLIYLTEGNILEGAKDGIEKVSSTANAKEVVAILESVLGKIPALTEEYRRHEKEGD